ncbi:MAG TPA: aspartate kinase [Thermoanaerobacterales bacterium]|jgi:aspartate kinase|nr:aspartate kinase [Thermoanaerobacterales bacterium]
MALIVQKFGGTSVKSPENRKAVLNHILRAKEKGYDVVVVVSAMGRLGDPYATDTLIELLKAQGGKVCSKKKDLIMACGEIISAVVMASYIEAQGVKAEAMTGFQAGIVTTADFGNADIIKVDPAPIKKNIEEGKIVVVAGFQGITEKDEITTLGRGGSDTTAVVLGGYLKADLVEIYTDVPGIAVTDPRIIPEAPFIPSISFDEVIIMAESGAKVIHPRAVRAAKEFNIPLRIKSTFDQSEGTLIGAKESDLPISGISLQRDLVIAKFVKEIELTDDEIVELNKSNPDETIYINDAGEILLIINEEQKDAVYNLAQELRAELNLCEDMSRVSVAYKDMADSNKTDQKINTLLFEEKIPIAASKVFNNCSTYIIKGEYGEKSIRAIYDGYFD